MITSYETGAVFKLLDEFSGPLRRLVEGLDAAGKKSIECRDQSPPDAPAYRWRRRSFSGRTRLI